MTLPMKMAPSGARVNQIEEKGVNMMSWNVATPLNGEVASTSSCKASENISTKKKDSSSTRTSSNSSSQAGVLKTEANKKTSAKSTVQASGKSVKFGEGKGKSGKPPKVEKQARAIVDTAINRALGALYGPSKRQSARVAEMRRSQQNLLQNSVQNTAYNNSVHNTSQNSQNRMSHNTNITNVRNHIDERNIERHLIRTTNVHHPKKPKQLQNRSTPSTYDIDIMEHGGSRNSIGGHGSAFTPIPTHEHVVPARRYQDYPLHNYSSSYHDTSFETFDDRLMNSQTHLVSYIQ